MVESIVKNAVTDRELINSSLKGDLAAFGLLAQRYWTLAVALALSRLENTTDAEDVAQESLMRAHAKLASLRDPDRFAGWLSCIVIQQCIDVHRQQERRRRALGRSIRLDETQEQFAVYSSNPGLTSQQIRFIRQTIANLPNKFKRPIIMRFVGGLSVVDIARQLNKRPGTVRVWLYRACQRLRQELAPLLEEV